MPTKLNAPLCVALWREALNHEIGIRIPVSDVDKARPMFYQARKAEGDASLEALQLSLPPTLDEIWLIKKSVEMFE